ncbi:MAG: pantoate--beta-alanine ligase, partial [Homoserinimonas sp.]|nr:pantoate--beta-alanine ligase [Homoserinimonas sp.]
PLVVDSIVELRSLLKAERAMGRSIALVPTMGALHDGHLALVARARDLADVVVVSIFVNPLQFGPHEDLDRYPRTLEADVERLGAFAVPFVFAPTAAEMYPAGEPQTRIAAGSVANLYEGASRPGHFDGMLTVVAKLLGIAQPATVIFGRKDAQQVFLVKRMITDLNLPVKVEVVPIVRDDDGLALSSRNRYLDANDRQAALVLSSALGAAAASSHQGTDAAMAAARSALAGEPLAHLDYLELVNPATFLPVGNAYRGDAIALVAARFGSTRLIDNRALTLS